MLMVDQMGMLKLHGMNGVRGKLPLRFLRDDQRILIKRQARSLLPSPDSPSQLSQRKRAGIAE